MSNLTKQARVDEAVKCLFEFLADIIVHPQKYLDDSELPAALKSQAKLCALIRDFTLADEHKRLVPVSLNSLKQRLLESDRKDRSIHIFDRMRKLALQKIQSASSPIDSTRSRSKSGLEAKIEALENTIDGLHAANLVLLQALDVNMRDLKAIADTPNAALSKQRINDAINRIIKILSLNPDPFNDLNILQPISHLRVVSNEAT